MPAVKFSFSNFTDQMIWPDAQVFVLCDEQAQLA